MTADVTVSQQPLTMVIAIIVALGGIASPIVMAWLTNRNARQMREEDYARQDVVAARLTRRQDEAEAKAAEVAAQAAVAAQLLVDSNHKQEEIAKTQNAKLDQIHSLVNSNLTAAMQDQLDTRISNLALLVEAGDAKKAAGLPQNEETLGAIYQTRIKIDELTAKLADRKKQTLQAAAQLAVDMEKENR
jgi:hypothetical protein